MVSDAYSAGDAIPSDFQVIEVRVAELKHLFNTIDPSPFREKDLDPKVEEFIVGWARDAPIDTGLGLQVHLDRSADPDHEASFLRHAVHEFFGQQAGAARRRLRELFRRGRVSLLIGLGFLGASIGVGDLVAGWMNESHFGEVLRESFLIGGWVAMWRPLEVFLYDWWPIRSEARLFDRLARMPVRIRCAAERHGT
jgi:hypothetical protein